MTKSTGKSKKEKKSMRNKKKYGKKGTRKKNTGKKYGKIRWKSKGKSHVTSGDVISGQAQWSDPPHGSSTNANWTVPIYYSRILAFPTQIYLPDNEYMVEDLGLYSGTKPKPSRYDFSLDLLYPSIVSEKTRHYTNRRYYKYLPSQNTTTYTSIIIILLLSGDISTNPGPVIYPCGKCSKPVKRNQRGIYCEDCIYWY